MRALLFCLTVVFGANWLAVEGASAATLRLERDGSGDFTKLQDALDAAAVGDTILIGPGRYDDFTVETFLSGGVGATIGNIHVDSLTIIGESVDTVFIGPEEMTYEFLGGYQTFGLVADNPEPVGWTIRNVTIENCFRVFRPVGNCEISGCRFISEAWSAVFMFYDASFGERSLLFEDCQFRRRGLAPDELVDLLVSSVGSGPSQLHVSKCTFASVGFNLSSVDSLVLDDVLVEDGRGTFVNCDGALAKVRIHNTQSVGISTLASTLRIEESEFRGGGGAATAYFSTESTIALQATRMLAPWNPVTAANEHAAVLISGVSAITARGTEFFSREDGYAVYAGVEEATIPEIDLSYNYWGTPDSLLIEKLIFDRADEGHPDYPSYWHLTRVRFWPWLEDGVPVRPSSVGGLKGKFRRLPK